MRSETYSRRGEEGGIAPARQDLDLLIVSSLKFVRDTARMKTGRGVLAGLLVGAILWLFPAPASAGRSVILAWKASDDTNVISYNAYYGTASRVYSQVVPTGKATAVTISGLAAGVTYYFAVTAVNAAGLESLPSSEVSYTVPLASPPVLALARMACAGPQKVFCLSSTGNNPAQWAIEASADLTTWSTLALGTNASVHLAVMVSSAPQLFFRLSSATPGVRLECQRARADGFPNSFTLNSAGPAPQQWTLEASPDLKTWTTFASGTNAPVDAAVVVSTAPSLFFRLKGM